MVILQALVSLRLLAVLVAQMEMVCQARQAGQVQAVKRYRERLELVFLTKVTMVVQVAVQPMPVAVVVALVEPVFLPLEILRVMVVLVYCQALLGQQLFMLVVVAVLFTQVELVVLVVVAGVVTVETAELREVLEQQTLAEVAGPKIKPLVMLAVPAS